MTQTEAFEYQPGVCNIDRSGVRSRRILTVASFIAGISSLIVTYAVGQPVWFRVVVAGVFGFLTAVNALQVKNKFCVSNASFGTMEVGRTRRKIADAESRKLDRSKRNRMLAQSLVIGGLSCLLGLVPV